MITTSNIIEAERLRIQAQLDATKTQLARNKLGQFATPTVLATQMLEYAQSLFPSKTKIRFLDPAIGTGSFFSALLHTFPFTRIDSAIGYEIDPLYGNAARKIWHDTPLELHNTDFTRALPPDKDNTKYNLLICNPPYVRHHHVSKDEKQRLQILGEQATGIKFGQQAGLYCHFLSLSHSWMAKNGVAGWLIPSEFMDVNYGQKIKKYLLHNVTLLRIHRFKSEDVQFVDALVSSAVVWFINKTSDTSHDVEFTYGGTLAKPEVSTFISTDTLQDAIKWTKFPSPTYKDASPSSALPKEILKQDKVHSAERRNTFLLSDLFEVKRGLATGSNDFFLLTQEQIRKYQISNEHLTPILPSPRYLTSSEIKADEHGNPLLESLLFLLTCNMSEEEVSANHPSLWEYLQTGVEIGVNHNYLCSHRKPWYSQENRPASLFLCSYMGRKSHKREKPFRFILNHSKALATNAYHILYPKAHIRQALQDDPQLARSLWMGLNAITQERLTDEGRVYGGGLHKMEPKELGNVSADGLLSLVRQYLPLSQEKLF